jgi:hypothetical protein
MFRKKDIGPLQSQDGKASGLARIKYSNKKGGMPQGDIYKG